MSLLNKTKNQERNNDPLIRLMTPMIAGILACVFCLVSMTWAWFSASVNTGTQLLQSATRSTSVMVYEVSQPEEEGSDATKTLIKPEIPEAASLEEDTETNENATIVAAGEALVWNLSPEKSYEVIMTGAGTASTGYCKIALSHTASGSDTAETKLYTTSAFDKDYTVKFTYNTGGFSNTEGVTETEWKEYVEKTTPPTLTIASYWGKPAEDTTTQVALMALADAPEQEIMLLSDGDVLGLAPIPCPEAKAESKIELEGFEVQEGAVISAEEDYKISLTLKEGYEMPSEVVVNIGGKDYTVSTQGAAAGEDAPYYDAQTGVLTVPSGLLGDGVTVSVKATATEIPKEETEEETTEEVTEETTEEATDTNETEEDTSADTSSSNNIVADNPNKKEEDGEQSSDEADNPLTGGGGNDDDNDEADNSGDSSTDNDSTSDTNEEVSEDEKADITLNLSYLTINLEETQIPTNADLVLTLSAKEDMALPEQIVITLDKTIRDENTEDEEITEDKTEYIINTDGEDNPEGFEYNAESGELTISSELLAGVREIIIADTEQSEATEGDEKATITFEVTNLTFDFTDDEVATDEDVVITFTAGEDYELPETITITIDDEEYIVYTAAEDSDKNPEGITFDPETGTLTISKDLLENADAITISAEAIKKEDEESEENPDAENKDESEGNETEGGETADKETESGTDDPATDDKTETEGEGETENGENTDTTTPETDSDNNPDGEDTDQTETTEPTPPTEPDTEDNTDNEQGTDGEATEENGEGDNGAENTTETTPDTESGEDSETTPDTENGENSETTTPTEPTTSTEPSEPTVTPDTSKKEESNTSNSTTSENNDDVNRGTTDTNSSSTENSSDSGNDNDESDTSSESTTSSSPSVVPTTSTTSTPAASKTSTQTGANTSSTPASSASATSTNSNSSEASQASGATTSSGNKETSSDE